MRKTLLPIVFFIVNMGGPVSLAVAQDDPKPRADKPGFGDRDDMTPQNMRLLKVRNETDGKLTVFLQYRTMADKAWDWVPADPAKAADALSFEVEPGKELDVTNNEQPVAASRMRIWATGPKQKWLKYQSKDAWLVPERNEDGEHVYLAPAMEAFTFVFSSSKDKGVIAGDSDVVGEQNLPTEGPNLPAPVVEIPWDTIPNPLPPGVVLIRDLAVLPVNVVGSSATVRVKNLGHYNTNIGRRLLVQKLTPGSLPEDRGPIGPLFHFSVKYFYLTGLTPGSYVAFVSPGDDYPYHTNDKRNFAVTTAPTHSNLAVLPVTVSAGKATVKVKNVGTADAPLGAHLKIQKLPGGPIVDHGLVGILGVGAIKTFAAIPLAAGSYKAFLSPGDAPPYHGNDADTFTVVAAVSADLEAGTPVKMGAFVKGTIHNNGPAAYPGGSRTWHIEKFTGGSWVAVPTMGSHVIPVIASGSAHLIQGTFTGAGMYRIRITSGDTNSANDVKAKMLP